MHNKDASVYRETDPGKKLENLRPKVPSGRKSKLPNRETVKRMHQEKYLPEFILDALQFGYLTTDGEGNISRVKLENPSPETLLQLIDSDVVARHMELKYGDTREVDRKVVIRDAEGNEVDVDSLKSHLQQVRDSECEYWPEEIAQYEPTYEEALLARVAAREKARLASEAKRKESKKAAKPSQGKAAAKLRERAVSLLIDQRKSITPESIKEMENEIMWNEWHVS